MPQNKKPGRLLRFSLKAFLLASVFLGVSFGWIAKNYHEYQIEQSVVDDAASKLAQSTNHTLTVRDANGADRHVAGPFVS